MASMKPQWDKANYTLLLFAILTQLCAIRGGAARHPEGECLDVQVLLWDAFGLNLDSVSELNPCISRPDILVLSMINLGDSRSMQKKISSMFPDLELIGQHEEKEETCMVYSNKARGIKADITSQKSTVVNNSGTGCPIVCIDAVVNGAPIAFMGYHFDIKSPDGGEDSELEAQRSGAMKEFMLGQKKQYIVAGNTNPGEVARSLDQLAGNWKAAGLKEGAVNFPETWWVTSTAGGKPAYKAGIGKTHPNRILYKESDQLRLKTYRSLVIGKGNANLPVLASFSFYPVPAPAPEPNAKPDPEPKPNVKPKPESEPNVKPEPELNVEPEPSKQEELGPAEESEGKQDANPPDASSSAEGGTSAETDDDNPAPYALRDTSPTDQQKSFFSKHKAPIIAGVLFLAVLLAILGLAAQ